MEVMNFTATRRGAAIVGLWAFGASCLMAYLLAGFAWLPGLMWLCAALSVTALPAYLASAQLRCGAHHLTLRRGRVLSTVRRMPLRFITGCSIWATPLQRMTGTCVLVVHTSGVTTLVPGVRRSDAERLAAHLSQGGVLR